MDTNKFDELITNLQGTVRYRVGHLVSMDVNNDYRAAEMAIMVENDYE